jgi:hypothetical protein
VSIVRLIAMGVSTVKLAIAINSDSRAPWTRCGSSEPSFALEDDEEERGEDDDDRG